VARTARHAALSPVGGVPEGREAGAFGPCFGPISRQLFPMPDRMRNPVTIDMTPDGGFVSPQAVPPQGAGVWTLRLGLGAAVIAAIAGAVAVAALVLWVASVMIPVALIAGVVAYAAFRFQMWRAQRSSRL